MASAYSTPKQFDNYVQPVNFELVNFVLQSKEQKFNYNIAKVEQTLADFGNLGLVRDQDKEYLADRINTMVSQMGDIENMDWSDTNIERQITSGIKGAIDEKVRKDIQMSRSYTNYINQVKEIKEKNPEQYSDINFAMGLKMAGADAWIQGEAEEFGNLQYTPYVDVKTEQNKFVQEYIKTHGDERIVEEAGEMNGVIIQKKIKGLSRAQVESIWEANMTPQQRQQLQMEGMYYAEQLPEAQRPEVVSRYKDNLREEVKIHKNTVDKLKARLSNVSDEKKAAINAQIQEIEGNIAIINNTINKPIDYQTAYLDSYYQMNKNAVVSANSFERVTDIERDKTLLDAIKVNAQIAKLQREEAEEVTTASGANLTVAASGGIDAEGTQLEVYTNQVRTQLDDAINGLVGTVAAASKDPSIDFKKTFGIDAHEFNKKTQEEKAAFVQAKFNSIEEGIDLKAEGGFTPEVISAYYDYKSSSSAFNAVNNGIQTASETIAKKSFDGMVEGYKGGDFKVENFRNPIIKSIIKSAGDKGISFESLSPDERKAFRAAMIDESIRGNHIDQEELMPYILQNRQELINSIEDESLKNQFVSNEMISSGQWERLGNTIWGSAKAAVLGVTETIDEVMNFFSGQEGNGYDETVGALSQTLGSASEMARRRSPEDLVLQDTDLNSLNTRYSGERDLGEGIETDASTFISNEYQAAVESARIAAGEAATRLPSTYVISLNPRVKAEETLARKGQQRIAIDKGFGTDDLANNSIQIHYNKADNTVQFSTVLKTSVQDDYDLDSARVMSNPVPIDQLTDMPEIMNRIQRDDTPWALDSRNPHAAPVKFTTTGFANSTEQVQTIQKLAPYLGEQGIMRLKAAPHSIGYTRPKIKSMFEEKVRQTPTGEQRSFVQEFPNTFQALSSGAGEFQVTYESAHNDGYYASVNYVIGDNIIPIQAPTRVGETLDYRREYLNSFQRQKQVIDMLRDGYELSDSNIIDKLKEIEDLYGN